MTFAEICEAMVGARPDAIQKALAEGKRRAADEKLRILFCPAALLQNEDPNLTVRTVAFWEFEAALYWMEEDPATGLMRKRVRRPVRGY